MTRIARKSDGRRIFTDAYKREQIRRVWNGELTVAELGRKLGIARSLLQRWKRLIPPEAANGSPVRTASPDTRRTEQYVRELQRLVGKQAVELEFVRAELEALRRGRRSVGAPKR